MEAIALICSCCRDGHGRHARDEQRPKRACQYQFKIFPSKCTRSRAHSTFPSLKVDRNQTTVTAISRWFSMFFILNVLGQNRPGSGVGFRVAGTTARNMLSLTARSKVARREAIIGESSEAVRAAARPPTTPGQSPPSSRSDPCRVRRTMVAGAYCSRFQGEDPHGAFTQHHVQVPSPSPSSNAFSEVGTRDETRYSGAAAR